MNPHCTPICTMHLHHTSSLTLHHAQGEKQEQELTGTQGWQRSTCKHESQRTCQIFKGKSCSQRTRNRKTEGYSKCTWSWQVGTLCTTECSNSYDLSGTRKRCREVKSILPKPSIPRARKAKKALKRENNKVQMHRENEKIMGVSASIAATYGALSVRLLPA